MRDFDRRTALSFSLFLVIFFISSCATAPQQAQVGEAPVKGSFADVYRVKALEYEKAGELRKALQIWEIVGMFSPEDREGMKKITDLKKQANSTAADHFKKGVAYFKSGSSASARKEFLLTVLYNPNHSEALDYLKNRLEGDDFTHYEVKKGDTLQSISQKIYNDPQKSFLITAFNDSDKQAKLLAPGVRLKLPVLELSAPKQAPEEEHWKPSETDDPQVKPVAVDIEGLLANAAKLIKAKKYQDALSPLESVLEHDSKNSRALDMRNASNYEMGKMMNEKKNYGEALKFLSRVDPGYRDTKDMKVKAQNRLADVHYNTGIKFFVNDQLEKAIREWEETLALNPTHTKARKDIENAQNLIKKLQNLK
ncbi:MAG: LysM domain-containing protein [Thermodesulfovibrionales bacterium]